MKRQIATIEALEAQGYKSSVLLFGDHPRRLEAVLGLFHGNLVMTLQVTTEVNGERVLILETTILRRAIEAYNEC